MEKDIPVYSLMIQPTEESEVEVDFVALVDRPAIERNFLAFNASENFVEPGESESESEFIGRCIPAIIDEGYEQEQAAAICYNKWEGKFAESYSDYPEAVSNNAKAALKWAEENGWGSCGTEVGKVRANQLAKGEPISLDTVKRMYSFLSRHKENADKSSGYGDGCGQLMYDAWGGASALSWAESKIRQAERMQQGFAIKDEDQRIISGALIIADKKIYRRDDTGEYYVYFPKETVKDIALKFFKKGYQKNVNLMHSEGMQVDGITMFESWITDKERGIMPMKGFEDVPDGSWFGSFKVENEEVWNMIKEGKVKGFSVEGIFNYSRQNMEANQKMQAIINILQSIN